MICFPSIIAYFLVLYEKKSINIAITGCPRFVIHAIFYVIFLSNYYIKRFFTKGKGYYGFNV